MAIQVQVTNAVYINGDPDSEKPLFTVTGASGAVTVAATAGTLASVGVGQWRLTPPNQSRTIVFTATDTANGNTALATVTIYGRFPLHAYFPNDADIGQKIEYSQSEDATPESEMSSVRGTEYIVFNYVVNEQSLSNYKLLRDFRRLHAGTYFYYWNRSAEEMMFCRFDSDIRRREDGFERYTLTCVLRGRILADNSTGNA